jgi:hypothetical protein
MTEEFEDDELFEEFEEDDSDEPADFQDEVEAISALVSEWEREAGVDLTDQEFDHVARQVHLYDVTPDEAYAHTDSGRFKADFAATVEAIQREQGRKLLDGELEAIWETASKAADDPAVQTEADVWVKAREATTNLLDTPEGRERYVAERLAVEREHEEPSAVALDEDGDETGPSFNYDNPAEREAAIDAALSGEAVSVHDSSDIEGD